MTLPLPIPFAPGGTRPPPPFFCAANLHGEAEPERLWHVADYIPARTVTILNGDGGIGKSLIALQLAIATARGTNWLGQSTRSGRTIFISAEDDHDELHRRLCDIRRAQDFSLAELDNLFLCSLAGEDALLSSPEANRQTLRETELFRRIEAWIAEHRPKLIVLDTLADLFGGDEINRAQARQFIGQLRGLCLSYDTTVLLLAHPSLSGIASGSGSSGSTAWNNSVRSRLYLRRPKGEDRAHADPDAREIEVMKANYGRAGIVLKLRWQNGVFVPEDGSTAFDRQALNAKADRVFAKLLRSFYEDRRRVNSSGGNTYAPTVFAKHPDAEGVTKTGFRFAMERAFADGKARLEVDGPKSRRVHYIVPGDAQ